MKLTAAFCALVFLVAGWITVEGYRRVARDARLAESGRNRVTISVKTTFGFHNTRAKDIADTWFQLAPENIYVFTDANDNTLNKSLSGHLINTNCGIGHTRDRLNCKMNAELELFTRRMSEWSCHFDDDNYVNIGVLLDVLDLYDHNRDWYLGKSSTHSPVEIDTKNGKEGFWFATGGAGICLSRALVSKLRPHISDNRLLSLGKELRVPDDMTLGYLINRRLGVPLTSIDRFHSHFEDITSIGHHEIYNQVSLSAGSYDAHRPNLVAVPIRFPIGKDKQRFRSLHCFLFSKRCPDLFH
ncbi:hypothetical protein QR680_001899 [Steinernema hermaphroditum]|uniref:Fringe-like glycosyltransferase domain-containing protein n=1 Tax=Steinernema hermaphroditum TaxID=289476 RepID=A0AA39LH23_9BILA|nr:hypothetical protein QR680_001899 [Steinernema hermaphroditum]